MQVVIVINMFSDAHFGVLSLMAIVAGVVVVDQVSIEPLTILPLVVALFVYF
jgi:hypothetical protein